VAAARAKRLGPGTIVADKYRLERVLGRGGMGMVIEAKHVQLGTSFALKFLHRSILGTETVPERFLREARATAALRSEHVCRVFDVGSFEGVPFLVMELLEGTDLEKVLRREKRIPPQVACSYIIQACAGVSEAHAAQIVHRDLKPGNLFLANRADGGSIVKVLDFGIAKAPQEAELGLTGTNAILGSPAYMSLEQLRSSRLVDTRSDIWSLGVILFELIAGRRPFDGAGVADLALRIAMEPNPSLPEDLVAGGLARGKLARVRGELDEIIARCLARDPADRYQSVAELALALAPFADEPERRIASSLGRAAGPSVVSIVAEPPPSESQEATTMQSSGVIEAAPRLARKPRARAGLVALAAAVVCGISLAVVAMSGGASPEARATAQRETGEAAVAVAPSPPPPPAAPAPAPAAPAPAPAAPVVPAPAPDAPPTISLRFAIEPAGAAVELDGVFVMARQITVRRDDVPHLLRISAPGYAAQEREVRFDDSQKLVIQLQRAAVARPAAASSRPARRPKIESESPYQ
jgi:serine/threonine protein kinase